MYHNILYLKYVLWDENKIYATKSQLRKAQENVDYTSEIKMNYRCIQIGLRHELKRVRYEVVRLNEFRNYLNAFAYL